MSGITPLTSPQFTSILYSSELCFSYSSFLPSSTKSNIAYANSFYSI
ncbi:MULTISPECIES: hypothetical protein [Romboutsia]|nr:MULTISPECIES: hypothetical protein [Romboutsia]